MGLCLSIPVICPLCSLVLLSNMCSCSCAVLISRYLVGLLLSFCRAFHWRMHLLTDLLLICPVFFVVLLCSFMPHRFLCCPVCYFEKLSRKEQCFEISFMPIVLGLLTVFQEQTGLIINAFLYKLP